MQGIQQPLKRASTFCLELLELSKSVKSCMADLFNLAQDKQMPCCPKDEAGRMCAAKVGAIATMVKFTGKGA